jgi:hypothetical protein
MVWNQERFTILRFVQSSIKRDRTGSLALLRTFPRCGTTNAKNAAFLSSTSRVFRLLC